MALRTRPTNDSDGKFGNIVQNYYDDAFNDIAKHPDNADLARAEQSQATQTSSQTNAKTPQELKEAENSPEPPKSPNGNGDSPTEAGDGLYKNKRRTASRFRLTRKGKVATGVAGVLVGGFGFISFMQAPNMAVQHFSELLKGRSAELQLRHQGHYRRTHIQSVSDLFTKDGRRAQRLVAHMERRGYQVRFDSEGKMSMIIAPDGKKITDPKEMVGRVDEYVEKSYPLATSRWKTKRTEAFYNRYKISRTSAIARSPNDPADAKKAVNKHMFTGVDGSAATEVTHSPPSGGAGEDKTAVDAHTADAQGDGSYNDIKDKLRNGEPVSSLTPEEQRLTLQLNSPNQDVIDVVERATQGSIGDRMFDSIKSFVSSVDVLDRMCTVKRRIAAIEFAARYHRALGLMRYAAEFIKIADKIRAGTLTPGDIDPEMLNAVMSRVTSVDSNGYSIGQSSGMEYLLNGEFSQSENEAHKSLFSIDGTLVGITAAIQVATDKIPGTSDNSCQVIQNTGFQIGMVVVELGIGAFTGGSGTVATQGIKAGITTSVKSAIQNVLAKQFARQAAKKIGVGAARGAAVDLTFEGAMALMQIHAEKAYALNFTGQEQGADLGNILVAGAGVLNKQRSLQDGMVPATTDQYEGALAALDTEKQKELRSQSFYARVFDYSNMDSLAFQTMSKITTLPTGITGVATMISSGVNRVAHVLSNPTSLLSTVGNVFLGHATANELNGDKVKFGTYGVNGVSLATTPAGALLPIMRSDIIGIDPKENIDALSASGDIDPQSHEPLSENFKQHIENCVNQVDNLTIIEKEDQTDPKFDCLAAQPITVRYKAHLAYLGMVDSLDSFLSAEEIKTL